MAIREGILYQGTIDLAVTGVIPDDQNTQGFNKFKKEGKLIMQLTSDDVSTSVTWSLEISADGENWDVAREAGDDVTGTLVKDEPYVEVFYVCDSLYFRISIDVSGNPTGNVSYILKDANR